MSDVPSGRAAERRASRALPDGCLTAWESELPLSDVQTLMLQVMRTRAAQVTPPRVLRRWLEDRFVRPSPVDARRLAAVEARIWSRVPDRFAGVELSPVAPLGLCSALGPVDQHRVVSTVRGGEVLSDPTNALAVEAAVRRRSGPREAAVELAACHRVVRAQALGPGQRAHFALFALVSSARDRGGALAEADLLIGHVRAWQDVLADVLAGVRTWITLTAFDEPVLTERLHDTVLPALAPAGQAPAVPVVEDPDRTQGRGYYRGAAFGLRAEADGATLDIGDGGLTTWTAQLLGDAKERCLVSCLSTEAVVMLQS